MGFQLRLHEDYTTGLVAVCDVCHKLINRPEEANLLWLIKNDVPGDFCEYKIACKDLCTHVIDAEGHQYSQELDVAIVYLINNTRIDIEKARRTAEIVSWI